ncbi:MAG: alpha/beta hydrolase [Balneolaceae bacterium]
MNYFKRIFIWLISLFLLGFIGVFILINTFDFSVSPETIDSSFSELQYAPRFKNVKFENRTIHYISIGDTSKQSVLFVHGSPGSWDNFLDFLSDSVLLNNYHLIAVDRLGFGKSGIGVPERSLEKQASAVNKVLIHQHRSAILVGHSYGGAVITKMAIDFPNNVDGLILVAASIDPKLEKIKWYQIPVHYKAFSWMLPAFLYSANEEILALKNELIDMIPCWKNITIPVSVIHGEIDNLVPPENADFAKDMLINASVNMAKVSEMNHFVPWTHPDLIKKEIEIVSARILDSN